jgi:hypothetical protein
MLAQFNNKLCKLGLNPETYKDEIKKYSASLTLQDIDSKCLKPDKFIEFCDTLIIKPRKLYDKYYSFVFSNYRKTLVQLREENNINQKQLAKILCISPVYLGLFEKSFKYPTRAQYLKLKEVLKEHAKFETISAT